MELFGMLIWDQLVHHAVNQEGGTLNLPYFLDVLESILDQILEQPTCLIFSNTSDALEAGHQKQRTRTSLAGHMCRWPRPHTPAKDEDVLLLHANDFIQIVVYILRIIQNIFLIWFENIVIICFMDFIFWLRFLICIWISRDYAFNFCFNLLLVGICLIWILLDNMPFQLSIA